MIVKSVIKSNPIFEISRKFKRSRLIVSCFCARISADCYVLCGISALLYIVFKCTSWTKPLLAVMLVTWQMMKTTPASDMSDRQHLHMHKFFLALNIGRHILYVALRLTYFFNAIFHSDSFGNFQRTVRRNLSKYIHQTFTDC